MLYCSMKTAISLPDPLFAEADAVATRLGISRSELYATALAEYLAKFRDAQITAKLNAVYERPMPPDKVLRSAAKRLLEDETW